MPVLCRFDQLRSDDPVCLHFGSVLGHLLVEHGETSERSGELVGREQTTRSILPGERVLCERLKGLALRKTDRELSEVKEEADERFEAGTARSHAHRAEELEFGGGGGRGGRCFA